MVDHGRMNPLSLFGLFAVTAMLLCYALEDRSRWFVLGFAVCPACWDPRMDSCRAPGPSSWSKLSGHSWHYGGGGSSPEEADHFAGELGRMLD